jgi:hypothetical protein
VRRRKNGLYPWDASRRVRWEERWWKGDTLGLDWRLIGIGPDVYRPAPGNNVPLSLVCDLIDWPGFAVWLFIREFPCPPHGKARTRVIMNTISVVRLPDLTAVPVSGLSLSTDFETWAWGVSLTLPDRDALALVSPENGPVEVRINVNGYEWEAAIEGYDERRQFGKPGYSVTGRSRSAYLASPYVAASSGVESQARNAVQLAEAQLLNSGFTLDWGTVDWLIPGGAHAWQGKTPIEVISTIAASVGARLQADRSADVIHVLPRYPVSPWEWPTANADAAVGAGLNTSLSLRWDESPAFNGVYVSGQSQGVLVHVKRTGTDGATNAGMVVDPLITTVAAATERGRNVLAEGGRKSAGTIELPILPSPQSPGLLSVGQLIDVDDGDSTWRALVTGTTITAGRPTVRQVVQVERYYVEAP